MTGPSELAPDTSSPAQIPVRYPESNLLRDLVSLRVLWLLGVGVLLLYACLHFVVVRQATPLTVREPAFIDNVYHLEEVGFANLYAYDAIPLRGNLYGPLYPLVVSVFTSPGLDPYLLHRTVAAGLLVAACLVLAVGLPPGVPVLPRVLAAAFLYSTHVASPSIAAGPDTLILALYTGCLVVLGRVKSAAGCMVIAVVGLALLFFSKPYGILVWGGYVSYLLLFRSWRWALANVAAAFAVALVLAALIAHYWPSYRFSVLEVHTLFATWFFTTLIDQVRDFAIYYFAVLILGAVGLWSVIPKANVGSFGRGAWRALRNNPPSFALWMMVVAAAALLGRIGWHGGAYLIYFYHLLLPPLLFVAFGEVWPRHQAGVKQWWPNALVGANLVFVLYLLPPWPEARVDRFSPTRGATWVDPVLTAWAKQQPMVNLIDNGQSEYLVLAGMESSDPEVVRRVEAWMSGTRAKLSSGDVRYVVLSAVHNRHAFMWGQQPSHFFKEHYRPVYTFTTRPYYLSFRSRRHYGRYDLEFVVFEHRRFLAEGAVEGVVSP